MKFLIVLNFSACVSSNSILGIATMHILVITLILVTAGVSYCQIDATTTDGRAVILKDDGTWQYKKASEVENKSCEEGGVAFRRIKA